VHVRILFLLLPCGRCTPLRDLCQNARQWERFLMGSKSFFYFLKYLYAAKTIIPTMPRMPRTMYTPAGTPVLFTSLALCFRSLAVSFSLSSFTRLREKFCSLFSRLILVSSLFWVSSWLFFVFILKLALPVISITLIVS